MLSNGNGLDDQYRLPALCEGDGDWVLDLHCELCGVHCYVYLCDE